jgi:hypothetical protein
MKNRPFSQEQIIAVLKLREAGRTVVELGWEIVVSNHGHLRGNALMLGRFLALLNIETPGTWCHPVDENRGRVKP